MTVREVGSAFRKMSLIAIVVIVFIKLLYALDFIFHFGWGYSVSDLKMGLLVMAFTIVLRFVVLRIIAFVDNDT